MSRNCFETSVEIPENPLDAARIYFGVMAYPELGAGQPGGTGARFAEALFDYAVWARRRARGLREVRSAFADPQFRPPEWRAFAGVMNRGLDRIRRRMVVFDLFQRRTLRAMSLGAFRMQPLSEAARLMPPWGTVLNRDVEGWRKLAALNRTGVGASDREMTAKDFRRRAIRPSIPVLHMAYGLWLTAPEAGSKISDWERRDPLTALYLNPELWVEEATRAAIVWRQQSDWPGFHGELRAHDMVELISQKSAS